MINLEEQSARARPAPLASDLSIVEKEAKLFASRKARRTVNVLFCAFLLISFLAIFLGHLLLPEFSQKIIPMTGYIILGYLLLGMFYYIALRVSKQALD